MNPPRLLAPQSRRVQCLRANSAFTLIEMLLVVAIIGILISLTVPFMSGAISSSRLTVGGESIAGMFSSAQQIASAEGCTVEARLYKSVRPTTGDERARYHSVVLFRHYEAGEGSPDPAPNQSGRPLTAPISLVLGDALTLPEALVITEDTSANSMISQLPDGASSRATKVIKSGAMVDYTFPYDDASFKSFIFRADSTNLDPGLRWFLTVVDTADEEGGRSASQWKNFFCVQVDPQSGRTVSYRP